MKKLAIFVEGQTEQIFVQKMLEELAGHKHVSFEIHRRSNLLQLRGRPTNATDSSEVRYQVLIYDCEGDEQVKSVALEQRESLIKAGYTLILGLRDLHPQTLADLPKVKSKLQYMVPTKPIRMRILLAVAEVEAWFVQDITHFERIDSALTEQAVFNITGLNLRTTTAESIARPADLLHSIYQTAGKAYRKKRKSVERTVSVLDCTYLYCTASALLPHFVELLQEFERFIEA
jgi:hypothetical protein